MKVKFIKKIKWLSRNRISCNKLEMLHNNYVNPKIMYKLIAPKLII